MLLKFRFLQALHAEKDLLINKVIRSTANSLLDKHTESIVCFVWAKGKNIYLTFPSKTQTETIMESYILSDKEDWNKAEELLADIIICKKSSNGFVAISVYRYFKMRGDTSSMGRGTMDKELQWRDIIFQSPGYDTSNKRGFQGKECDHTNSVGSFQRAIALSTDTIPVGLVELNIYLTLMYMLCNAEENAESVPTLINSIRMIIVHMMMNGLDAVKIASLISSYQEYPYQHTTTFGRITIMSDIIRVGGYELFFEVFAELSLSYKQSVDCLKETITPQTPSLVVDLIENSSDTFLSYSDLLDPIKAME